MRYFFYGLLVAAPILAQGGGPARADFSFATNDPDGRIGVGSRPGLGGKLEIEAADDFVLTQGTSLTHATFTGLLPTGVNLSQIGDVRVEIYRVFPNDSTVPPSGNVPTRANSPSDVAFAERDASSGNLNFTTSVLNTSFTANNSVLSGIHPFPNQTTGGETAISGQELRFDVNFTVPFNLPADHYFFVPQVEIVGTGDFFWLSAPRPIVPPGTAFLPDLQAWVRNDDLSPDWLRVGTDIVGGNPVPTFNMAFSLDGHAVPEPASVVTLLIGGLTISAGFLQKRRKRPTLGSELSARVAAPEVGA